MRSAWSVPGRERKSSGTVPRSVAVKNFADSTSGRISSTYRRTASSRSAGTARIAPLAPPKFTPRTANLYVIARASSWLSRSVTSGARRVPPALVGQSKSNATNASTVFSRRVFISSPKVGTMESTLLTSVVGSYPQPDWLVDRAMLSSRLPPRTRALEIWRVAPQYLEQAQDDATVLAIRDLERAGIDIITDGEIRRESYSNRFATALEGMDLDHPGTALDRTGHPNPVPRVVGPLRRARPVEVRDVEFLRASTTRTIKATLPGPFTMSQQAQDDYYHDEEALAMALAEAVNDEVRDLFAAGADVVQLDEPYLQARAEKAQRFAVKAINRALAGAP